MSSPPVRRNDPCPCGSTLRYKECHGKLAGAGPSVDDLVRLALQVHQQGNVDEAERRYRAILERDPGNAIATHYLGLVAWHRDDASQAERLMRASIEANAGVADFHNNLGLLLRDTRRLDEALECFRRTLSVDPGWFEAYNNLGLTFEAANRWPEACEAYREAIAREPRFAVARQNLARALLTLGEFREGWEQYRWRLVAQGVVSQPPDAALAPWPDSLAGRTIALRAEQGLGDVLFFLRFAPELTRRGARLAFRGDARLHPILARTGLFELGFDGENAAASGMQDVFIGDLPWLLRAHEPERFPSPLPLAARPERVGRLADRLRALGPGRLTGLTWRAGTVAPGPRRTHYKHIAPEMLAASLPDAGERTFISVQRLPREGEREALERALAAPVHDMSAANDDLEEILAVMAVLDDYVGVSNFNTHLRAGLGKSVEVLVPFPPEWRWGFADRSPWFKTARIVRQLPDGSWPEPGA